MSNLFEPKLINKIEKKILKCLNPFLVPLRRKKLKTTDFSIISNNCWGGCVYEWYGLKKKSPTVGCFMFADDYIKFISNLKYYLSLEIEMHISKESKHFDKLVEYNSTEAPIGFLDDIEVIMLHYKDPQIAKEKWERRKKRINWDNLIIKFSYMNECTQQMLKEFDNMELDILNIKKIMFIKNPDNTLKCGVYFPGFEDSRQIINDTYFFNKYFNLDKFINEGDIERRN